MIGDYRRLGLSAEQMQEVPERPWVMVMDQVCIFRGSTEGADCLVGHRRGSHFEVGLRTDDRRGAIAQHWCDIGLPAQRKNLVRHAHFRGGRAKLPDDLLNTTERIRI